MSFNLLIKEFENRYKKEKNVRAKTRLHILLLRRKNYSQEEISSIIEVTQGTVSNVCRRFVKEGWKQTRNNVTGNIAYNSAEQLKKALRKEWNRQKFKHKSITYLCF